MKVMILPAQITLQWIGAQIVAGLVGVTVGLFLRELLPESFKAVIVFWGGRTRKWIKNRNYKIRLSSDYRFESPLEFEEVKEEIAKELGQRPQDVGRFDYMESQGSSEIRVELDPQYAGSVNLEGDINVDVNFIDSIIATFECSPNYRDLVPTLLDLQSIERTINETMTAHGARSGETIIRCDMPAKPILQKLLGSSDVETLRTKSEDGTRIDVSRDEIQVHSPPKKSILPTIRKAIVFYS